MRLTAPTKFPTFARSIFFLVGTKAINSIHQADDTKGQSYALAKDEMCRKTFNVSEGKLKIVHL